MKIIGGLTPDVNTDADWAVKQPAAAEGRRAYLPEFVRAAILVDRPLDKANEITNEPTL